MTKPTLEWIENEAPFYELLELCCKSGRRPEICCHQMGGRVVWWIADEYPERPLIADRGESLDRALRNFARIVFGYPP